MFVAILFILFRVRILCISIIYAILFYLSQRTHIDTTNKRRKSIGDQLCKAKLIFHRSIEHKCYTHSNILLCFTHTMCSLYTLYTLSDTPKISPVLCCDCCCRCLTTTYICQKSHSSHSQSCERKRNIYIYEKISM